MTNHVVDRQTRDERARVVIDTCDVILRALRGEPQRREVTDRRILRGWGERAVVGRRAATNPQRQD